MEEFSFCRELDEFWNKIIVVWGRISIFFLEFLEFILN